MRNSIFQLIAFCCLSFYAHGQEEQKNAKSLPLEISGSIDLYYKYDLSGQANIETSFASDHNSFSIGMLNLIATKTVGKASFVADIGLGPRNAASVGPSVTELQPGIQNLYVNYALSDQLSITAGYMGTFVGYEVISPTGNFNYSTSYLFTNGPFQNAGVKFQYSPSEKFSVMAGVFNDWNVYQQDPDTGINSIGGQLYFSPADGWDLYLNMISGRNNGSEIDLTTSYSVTPELFIGLNVSSWTYDIPETSDDARFKGVALYTQYSFSEGFAVGLRSELFGTENTGYIGFDANSIEAGSVSAFTLSANIGSGAMKFIPEVRLDSASKEVFLNSDGSATKTAMQALAAVVFSF